MGNNELFRNYRKHYWELYNEIKECSEELAVVSYKLELTLGEKLWEDMTLNPPADLRNLMTQLEMFARLEDDVKQAKWATGSSFQGDSSFKKHREIMVDHDDRVRQGINVVFKEPIYKLLSWI